MQTTCQRRMYADIDGSAVLEIKCQRGSAVCPDSRVGQPVDGELPVRDLGKLVWSGLVRV